MGQKKKRHPRLEDLIPDKERREEIVRRMYNREPIVGEDGIFTDLLQALVNVFLDGAHLKKNITIY